MLQQRNAERNSSGRLLIDFYDQFSVDVHVGEFGVGPTNGGDVEGVSSLDGNLDCAVGDEACDILQVTELCVVRTGEV